MGRGSGGRPTPGGVPRLTPGLLAAVALSVLTLFALPLAAADPGLRPLSGGPVVWNVAVAPQPVVPDVVTVTARASDNATGVREAEFFIDAPGIPHSSLSFRLDATVPPWGNATEGLYWANTYDVFTRNQTLAAGTHVLYLHAMDGNGTWGDFTTFPFSLLDPATAGPIASSVVATPSPISAGALLTVTATFADPFKRPILGAEVFFDIRAPPGTGFLMSSSQFGLPGATATVIVPADLPFGTLTAWARARNDVSWGAPSGAALTVLAPAFTLAVVPSPPVARPGELVTYAIAFENRGNDAAAFAWVNLTLPPKLAFVDDTAATVNGTSLGGAHYRLADVMTLRRIAFDVRAQVAPGATDGIALATSVALDFTNAVGWNFPAVLASASATVIAPEVSLAIAAPPVAYAAQTVTLAATITNSGVRVIPRIDVALAAPADLAFVGDSTGSIGGTAMGRLSWRFADVAPGVHPFDVTWQVPAGTPDREPLAWAATASYVSRLGSSTDVTANAASVVGRPAFTVSVAADAAQVEEGGRVGLTLLFANDGSIPARSVRLVALMPSGLARVGGDLPSATVGGQLIWDFASVGPGSYAIALLVEARTAGASVVQVELTYTSPDGGAFPIVAASRAIDVAPPTTAPLVYASVGVTGSLAALAALLATERGKTAFLFVLVPLYTRLRHDHVLDHETRGMIRGYIVANPGDHYNAIKEALELPNGTLAYHIQVLQKESIVKSVKDGKFRRFYPYDMRLPEGGQPTKIQRVILDLIRANPGITPRDTAGLLGLTSSTVSYHLEKLEELGRIEHRREGISKRLYVKREPAA